jgi:hypothetical protein
LALTIQVLQRVFKGNLIFFTDSLIITIINEVK